MIFMDVHHHKNQVYKKSKFIIKRNGQIFFAEYKIQGLASKRNPYCARYCLFLYYLTKVLGIYFKSAVLNLYYQLIQ